MTPEEELIASLVGFDYPKRAYLNNEGDMVMKGGITSRVVYPLAVCELAKTRRFKNVGGISAGGIAAAMAAAAEIGRDRGGFQELAKLPTELGDDLGRMFQPSETTKPLFRVLMASIDKERDKVGRLLRALGGVITAPPGFGLTLTAGVPLVFWGLLATAGAAHDGGDWAHVLLGVAFGAVPAVGLAVLSAKAGSSATATACAVVRPVRRGPSRVQYDKSSRSPTGSM